MVESRGPGIEQITSLLQIGTISEVCYYSFLQNN